MSIMLEDSAIPNLTTCAVVLIEYSKSTSKATLSLFQMLCLKHRTQYRSDCKPSQNYSKNLDLY